VCCPGMAGRSHRAPTGPRCGGPLRRAPAATRTSRLKTAIARVHADNYAVFGARKVWLVLNREGITVARCTVERTSGKPTSDLVRPAGFEPATIGLVPVALLAACSGPKIDHGRSLTSSLLDPVEVVD
jgi:hypothetical protein